MKLNKVLILLVAIAFGMTACNSDDVPVDTGAKSTDTYASITVKFPGSVNTRSLPGDFNLQGTWTGRDNLNKVDVFLVNVAKGVVNYNSFTKSAFAEIDAAGILKPNLALKATAGENVRVYVVINGETSILTTLRATSAGNFATAFAGEAAKIASQVASYDAISGKETIMMTNDADNYPIAVVASATEAEALAGTKNHAQVQVERVVSRAMLTVVPEASAGAGWPVSAIIGGVATPIAKVTGVTYAVGQSNMEFYIMKKADYSTPDPVYTFNPTDLAAWTAGNTNLDYTGLLNFTAAQPFTYDAAGVSVPLASEATSKFVLPVNHVVGETVLATARNAYKKGNTTYFEIRASFIPLAVDGAAPTFAVPTTVYLGQNDNKFYSTRALAEAEGQKATEYIDGIMKYVLWLNPNSTNASVDPNPMVSPTVRNRVYHAHIDAFLRMGVANNPLASEPTNPLDPENPIRPFDPLKTDVTYLSVSVKVLPWTIHSYKISLSDDMY